MPRLSTLALIAFLATMAFAAPSPLTGASTAPCLIGTLVSRHGTIILTSGQPPRAIANIWAGDE